jgi:AraC-like DNA-binding protein
MLDSSLYFRRSEVLPFVEMRQAFNSSACYHTHSHDEFSFGVIDNGGAEYRNLHQINQIGRGSTVTINPGDAHACNPDAGEWSYRMLFVDSQWIGSLQRELFNSEGIDYLPFPALFNNRKTSYQHFDQLFHQLLEANNSLAAETQLIEFLQNQFTVGFKTSLIHGKDDNHHIHRVRELIMDQLDNNWSLDQFSNETGLSRYHLIRSFKAHYGQSPHAYQLNQRINKAKGMLRKGGNLAETAQRLGFADQAHFQRNFKKRVAVTPKQYQSFFC